MEPLHRPAWGYIHSASVIESTESLIVFIFRITLHQERADSFP